MGDQHGIYKLTSQPPLCGGLGFEGEQDEAVVYDKPWLRIVALLKSLSRRDGLANATTSSLLGIGLCVTFIIYL